MLIDIPWLTANTLPPVVIIGSGPAGISLALQLEANGIGCVVLEAGGEGYTEQSQDFFRGEVVGDPYYELEESRLRMFGGTSSMWGGWCRPLEADDFLPRSDIAHSGWPIRKEDLDPYLAKSSEILELPAFTLPRPNEDIDEIDIAIVPPVQFGIKYGPSLNESKLMHLALNAAVERIEAEDGAVSKLVLRGPDGAATEIAPRYVVMACGGIENSRLLLWSNETSPSPVVPHAETLGRYWMEHPTFHVGDAMLDSKFQKRIDSAEHALLFYAPSYDAMRRHGVLNANLRVHGARQKTVLRIAACTPMQLSTPLFGAVGSRIGCENALGLSWEQAPDPENRIALGEARDAFGVPRPVLHWRKSAFDLKTARVALELFGKALIEKNLGKARVRDFILGEADYPSDDELAGYHHMGGTRMADSPAQGVTDRNLKVFGIENLYITGSSVYPTCGHANPTMTIVQMALRLGDHLKAEIASR